MEVKELAARAHPLVRGPVRLHHNDKPDSKKGDGAHADGKSEGSPGPTMEASHRPKTKSLEHKCATHCADMETCGKSHPSGDPPVVPDEDATLKEKTPLRPACFDTEDDAVRLHGKGIEVESLDLEPIRDKSLSSSSNATLHPRTDKSVALVAANTGNGRSHGTNEAEPIPDNAKVCNTMRSRHEAGSRTYESAVTLVSNGTPVETEKNKEPVETHNKSGHTVSTDKDLATENMANLNKIGRTESPQKFKVLKKNGL